MQLHTAAPAVVLVAFAPPQWRSRAAVDEETAALSLADVVVADNVPSVRALTAAGVHGAWAASASDDELAAEQLVAMLHGLVLGRAGTAAQEGEAPGDARHVIREESALCRPSSTG